MTIECPRCEATAADDASYCPECGLDIEELREYARNDECPRCEVPVEGDTCPECGLPMDELRERVLSEDEQTTGDPEASDDGGSQQSPTDGQQSSTGDRRSPNGRDQAGTRPNARSRGGTGQHAGGGGAPSNDRGGNAAAGQGTVGEGGRSTAGQGGQDTAGQASQGTSGQAGAGQGTARQGTAGQAGTGQGTAGQGGAGQGTAGQGEVYCIGCGALIHRQAEMCPQCGQSQVPPGGWANQGQSGATHPEMYEYRKLAHKSLGVNLLLAFILPPIAYLNVGRPGTAIVNLITFNFLLVGFVAVPIHVYSIISTARDRVRAMEMAGA